MNVKKTGSQKSKVRIYLSGLLEKAENGQALPTYSEISETLGCSQAPVREVMAELEREGRVTLRRGRPAQALKFISFRESALRRNLEVRTQSFNTAYLPVPDSDEIVRQVFDLGPRDPCLMVSRIRSNREKGEKEWKPVAFHRVFINPTLVDLPARFFLDNDPSMVSLSEVYAQMGYSPERSSAGLQAGLATPEERDLLDLPKISPVLRSEQTTYARKSGTVSALEYLYATYTSDIVFPIERFDLQRDDGDGPQ